MNAKLSIRVDWEDPCSAKGEESRATWCRLAIFVGDVSVTRVEDDRAQTVRDAVYCPAYPLAEWFAFNWWALLNETERPFSIPKRHNIRFAREGFALPDLELFSEDSLVRLVWKPHRPAAAPVRFLEEGFALLDKAAAAAEMAAFVDKVVARLQAKDLPRTSLAEEWAAIGGVSNEEAEFCATAGSLGLDPYCLDERQAKELISISGGLPAELRREFFLAANPKSLQEQASWLRKCLGQLELFQVKSKLAGRKGAYSCRTLNSTPWRDGYELADRFRREIFPKTKLKATTIRVDLDGLLGVASGQFPGVRVEEERGLDAVAMLSNEMGPQIATSRTRQASKNYLLARAICDFLCSNTEQSSLLTPVDSDRQKRNRAFAAEFLAPAEGIRQHLSGSRATQDEIEEIAEHYGVSERLVSHQIHNHQLATTVGSGVHPRV